MVARNTTSSASPRFLPISAVMVSMMMNSIYLSDWANRLVPAGNLARSLSSRLPRLFINPIMSVRFSVFLCERGSDKSLILGFVFGYKRVINIRYRVKYGARVLGQLSDSRTSYYAPVTIVKRAG